MPREIAINNFSFFFFFVLLFNFPPQRKIFKKSLKINQLKNMWHDADDVLLANGTDCVRMFCGE